MDNKNDGNKDKTTNKLAEIIAGQDIDSLKEMILEQMGIDDQDELIDRVLDILDDEEDENEVNSSQVVELYQNRQNPREQKAEPKQESKLDPLELLLNNKDFIFNMLKNKFLNVQPEDDPRVQLLYALKPFCNDKRQSKIDQAVQMMGLTRYINRPRENDNGTETNFS